MFQHLDEDDSVEQQLRSELAVLEAKSHLENSNLRAENIKLRDERVHWSDFEKKAIECVELKRQPCKCACHDLPRHMDYQDLAEAHKWQHEEIQKLRAQLGIVKVQNIVAFAKP